MTTGITLSYFTGSECPSCHLELARKTIKKQCSAWHKGIQFKSWALSVVGDARVAPSVGIELCTHSACMRRLNFQHYGMNSKPLEISC
jgi:hypothetical protein